MLRTLIVGLGRAGAGLHLPVLLRLRRTAVGLFAPAPVLAVDPAARPAQLPAELRRLPTLAAARAELDPARTVVHVCTPPRARAALVAELAELGFERLILEKPLATDPADLAALAALVHRHRLQVAVVAPWLASALTDRLTTLVRGGPLGELRRIAVRQHKPRFRRSLTTDGHPTAFDVELPHSLGVVLRLAGDAEVAAASCHDLRAAGRLRPGLGGARLLLAHHGGVRSELVSDLTSPVRERRITLRFAHGTATGHYPGSADDEYAQLRVDSQRLQLREVFPDDSLGSYLQRTYARFLAGPLAPEREFAPQLRAVQLLGAAKALSGIAATAPALTAVAPCEPELTRVH
ncbi:oxidoreductase [Streptomyces tateyamensis]|uniref:Oxidoreductase n=1 Tax=Streptomyces tateyamensis TaxID=565073 RepID=A0A2V4N8N0_9ACTN|nr:Gfo/Idh/MocA family oxidoreductase [Streptomyces tateyamensis]PYC80522.1 oxidoreductase [Streptomyces tateyamensis]